MSIYNKTTLKKVKKDELIQMFLDLQAQKINDSMDEAVEKCCNNAIEGVVEDLKAENQKLKNERDDFEVQWHKTMEHQADDTEEYEKQIKKLKGELDDWHKALNEDVEGLEHLQSGINLHFWQRCSGPWDADIEKVNQK